MTNYTNKTYLGYRLICEQCGDKVSTWILSPEADTNLKDAARLVHEQGTAPKHEGHTFVKLEFRARTIEALWQKIDRSGKKLRKMLAVEAAK